MNKKNLRKGFTTVELVIVIAVIAILATALIPTFGGLIDSANETKYMQEARQIFNNFLLEHAEDGVSNSTYYIKTSNGWFYKVTAGKMASDPVLGADNKPTTTNPTDGAIVEKGSTADTTKCNHIDAGTANNICDLCGDATSAG